MKPTSNGEAIKNTLAITAKIPPTQQDLDWFNQFSMASTLARAALKPIPKKIIGDLWFEGDILMMYAPSNVGKSLLGMQIGEAAAAGIPLLGLKNELTPQRTLLFDFEQTDTQQLVRYSDEGQRPYNFHPNLIRIGREHINRENIVQSMEDLIWRSGAKVVIIDNTNAIDIDLEKAKYAKPLMNMLKDLKHELELSITIVSATPKRDNSKPLTENDLSGSSVMYQLADSSFVIGKSSRGIDWRYIKQLKSRLSRIEYHEDHVMVCQVIKEPSYLKFVYHSISKEELELPKVKTPSTQVDEHPNYGDIVKCFKEGISTAAAAKNIGMSKETVCTIYNKLKNLGPIDNQ